MAPTRKRQRTNVPNTSVQIAEFEPPAVDIGSLESKFGMQLTPATTILNKFVLKLQKGLHVENDTYQYTPVWIREPNRLQGNCVHISELQDYEPRKRHYVLLEDKVALMDDYNPGESPSWFLSAHNTHTPDAPPVHLFVLAVDFLTNMQTPPVLQRLITKKVCTDRQVVVELGKLLVRNMNKFPGDLNIQAWEHVEARHSSTTGRIVLQRRISELAALVQWKKLHHPSFELEDMPKESWHKTAYGAAYQFGRYVSNLRIMEPRAIYWGQQPQAKKKLLKFDINIDKIDAARIIAADALMVPSGLDLILGAVPSDLKHYTKIGRSEEQIIAAFDLARAIQYDLIGMIGPEHSIKDKVDRFCSEYYIGWKAKRRQEGGPYNGQPFWSGGGYRGMHWEFGLYATVLKDMDKGRNDHADVVVGALWTVDVRIAQAFIMQHALRLLAGQSPLMDVLISALSVAQSIAQGDITMDDMISRYSIRDADPLRAEYYCMLCHRLYVLAHLVFDAEGRLVCSICCDGSYIPQGKMHHFRRICYTKANSVRSTDMRYGNTPTWTASAMVQKLFEEHKCQNPDYWKPGLMVGEHEYNLLDSQSQFIGTKQVPMPLAPSLDKVYSSWYSEDNGMCLHHPDNVLMVFLCIQFLKGMLSPSALPIAKKALQLRKESENQRLSLQYEASIADEWKVVERAADNQYMISKLTPYSNKERLLTTDIEGHSQIISMQYSGIWDGLTYSSAKTRNVMATRGYSTNQSGHGMGKKHRTMWALWTDTRFEEILTLINKIERDTGPHGMNRHELILPRIGPDKMPWLWLLAHAPASVVFDKDAAKCFFFYEFLTRLWTLDEECDEKNETFESPDTLLMEYVVQWFERAGRCHFFGMTLTCVTRHFSSYSLGRGVTQIADGGEVAILPGAPVATGWSVLHPTVLEQYNIARRTCIYESWRANAMRSYFLGGAALLVTLETAVEGLCDSTKWYAPLAKLEDYAVVTCVKRYPLKPRGQIAAFMSATGESTGENSAVDDDADPDEETEFRMLVRANRAELTTIDNDTIERNNQSAPIAPIEDSVAIDTDIIATTNPLNANLAAGLDTTGSDLGAAVNIGFHIPDNRMDYEHQTRPSLGEQVSMSNQQLIELGPVTKADEEEYMQYCSGLYDKVLATYHIRLQLCGREPETVVSQQTHDDWVTDQVQWASLVRNYLPPAMVQEHDLRMSMLVAEMASLRKISG